MEDGDVILIAPPANNQDGSQTFYILDPCPSSEDTDEPPEIELIDMTAEVKNTGAIAVVSTNCNTGALEITLTNKGDKLKIEAMDPKDSVATEELNDSSSNPYKQESEGCFEEEFSVKLEEGELEVVDINQHSSSDCVDASVTEQSSEADSLNYEAIEQSQQIEMEQDEVEEGTLFIDDNKDCESQEELSKDIIEVEEGTLFIDDNKDCESQEELSKDIIEVDEEVEILPPSSDRTAESAVVLDKGESIIDEVVMEQTAFENRDDEIAINDSSMKHINTSAEDAIELQESIHNSPEDKETCTNNQEPQIQQQTSASLEGTEIKDCGDCVGIVHGHVIKIPSSSVCTVDDNSVSESVDSTNTALTLLELAGGSSYRHSVEQSTIEMEMLQFEAPNPSPSLVTCIPSEPTPELTTLTPLQPVPLEHSTENSFGSEEIIPDKVPETKTESSSTSTQARKVKVSTELVQRLLESEESSKRPQYKHLLRPSVSKSEIAQEIYERARQKYPYSEDSGRDVIFAMKIAHRLASKIVSPEKSNELPHKTSTELQSLSTGNSFSTPLSRKDVISKYGDESKIQPKKKDAISDKIELLKILEDDPDDPGDPESDLNQSLITTEKKPKIKISRPRAPLLKLHPELEKELALKQLQNFGPTKKKVGFEPESLKKIDVIGRGRPRKKHEHNNNSQRTVSKRKTDNFSTRSFKKLKSGAVNSNEATADPSKITETLTVGGHDFVEEQSKEGKSIKQYSNKRLSRNSETPPREVPMEILLNGIEDGESDIEAKQNLSKNKIFKATNTRKRQEELKKKHFANMLQRNKPQKKRGRPPKKKPLPTDDELNKEFIMKVVNEQSKPSESKDRKDSKDTGVNKDSTASTTEEKPFKTKKLREIERLLGDEGAINMLYSVEQKRKPGGEPKSGVLTYRKKKKDLMLKTKLVKSAVLRLSASPVQTIGRISLRGQGMKDDEGEQQSDDIPLRKMSVDSRDSHQSLSSPPTEAFSFPAKIVPAEASRIIRRHSSSSNYSSRSNSPRRVSVDGERLNVGSPEIIVMETGQGDASLSNVSRNSKHAIPSLQSNGEVTKKAEKSNQSLTEPSKKHPNEQIFHQPKTCVENKKTGSRLSASAKKTQLTAEQNIIKRPGRLRKRISLEEQKKSLELSTTLAAANDEFTKESENENENIPEKIPKMNRTSNGRSTTKVAVYSKNSHGNAHLRTRKPIVYHELTLKRQHQLVEITLNPVTSTIKNALNIDVMKELIAVLTGLIKDENCRVVLLNSAGNIFCQGVDFPALVQPTLEERMTAAQDMALALKEFIKTMAIFPKPIIAAVQGPAVGLGTTLLPLCDLVLASSEATFHTPYARLGQVPEGAATLTLPSVIGNAPTSELLFVGRKLTAEEAHKLGLVTRIIPTETFEQDIMSVVTTIASQSVQAMSATKALLRHTLLTNLETTLVSETHLLTQHWTSDECQAIFTKYLQDKGAGTPPFVFTQTQP